MLCILYINLYLSLPEVYSNKQVNLSMVTLFITEQIRHDYIPDHHLGYNILCTMTAMTVCLKGEIRTEKHIEDHIKPTLYLGGIHFIPFHTNRHN